MDLGAVVRKPDMVGAVGPTGEGTVIRAQDIEEPLGLLRVPPECPDLIGEIGWHHGKPVPFGRVSLF